MALLQGRCYAGSVKSMKFRNRTDRNCSAFLHSVGDGFMSFLDDIKKPEKEPPASSDLIEPSVVSVLIN